MTEIKPTKTTQKQLRSHDLLVEICASKNEKDENTDKVQKTQHRKTSD